MAKADFPTKGPIVVRFCEQFLTLNGSFAGRPFVPLPWMADVLDDIYRINPDTGRRLRRTYLLGVPRKNAKSTLGAALAVYHLVMDRSDAEPQIISAASTRDQARLVFNMARGMVESNQDLAAICKVYRSEIHNTQTGGVYKVVSSEAGSVHGINPSCVIIDEFHAHRNDELMVALTTGSAMRSEPLTVVISTAGHDMDSPLGKLYSIGRKVESGEVVDESFGFTWFGPREEEDVAYDDEALWKKYNPSWDLMNIEEFRSTSRVTAESEFIRYRLNGWTATQDAWLPAGVWAACRDKSKKLEQGDRVILGFDGSFSGDATALVAVRVDDLHLEPVALWERPDGDKAWRVPVQNVEDSIRAAFELFTVQELVADPYFFQVTLQRLEDSGFPVIEFPTNGNRMHSPTKTFFDSVLDGELSHNGDPALARHVANTIIKHDARGSRIGKEYRASTRYVDLTVASVLALGRARAWREQEAPREATVHLL